MIAVVAGVRSTVKVRDAGVASAFPEGSVARAWIVCGPSPRVEVVKGVGHETKLPPSTRHSNDEPGSVDVKVKVGVDWLVRPFGPAICVSGAVWSPCQVGRASAPAALVMRVWPG